MEEDPLKGLSDTPLIVFAGGGTGGHLYPALAVAEAFRVRNPGTRFRFFGTERDIDRRILETADHELVPQSLPTFARAPWKWPQAINALRRAGLRCREQFEVDRPDVVIGTGGMGSIPAVREAVRSGIPTALLNPDAIPGRANRFLAKHAHAIFVQWEDARRHFRNKSAVHVTGCPVRGSFNRAARESGIQRFELDPKRKTLLITGASLGARTVNEAIVANLEFLSANVEWQIIHLTGEREYQDVRRAYETASVDAKVLPYTDYMADALAAADLVVGRAGASTLAELTAVGRASVLMPYPFHRDQHQVANARCLVRASAARIVIDQIDPAKNGPKLWAALDLLMRDDAQRMAMTHAARRLGQGQAALSIADHLMTMIGAQTAVQTPESARV